MIDYLIAIWVISSLEYFNALIVLKELCLKTS